MLQCSIAMRGWSLARQAFEDFEAPFERAQFAVRELGDTAFEGFIGDRGGGEVLPSGKTRLATFGAPLVRALISRCVRWSA